MATIKREGGPVLDVILQHLQTFGACVVTQQNSGETSMNGVHGTESSAKVPFDADSRKRYVDDINRYKVTFEVMAHDLIVPCVLDTVNKEKLIPVKVANSKICSVYPNVDQVADHHSELRKPLSTRSIKSESLLEIFNHVLKFHCADEYGTDYSLELMDRFVVYEDFAKYYKCVRKAFPRVSNESCQRVPENEVIPIQGGFLKLSRIVCPYILRSNVALLPVQLVKIAAFGTSIHSVFKESISYLKGWLASPRELAFLTFLCQQHQLPLVFGRDTRLVPLPQVRTLFKDKQGFEILNFPDKDDASDQQRVIPTTSGPQRPREESFSNGSSLIVKSASNTLSSINMRSAANTVTPTLTSLASVPGRHVQTPAVNSNGNLTRSTGEVPLIAWNLRQMSNLPVCESDSLHKQQKRRRVEKNATNVGNSNSLTAAV